MIYDLSDEEVASAWERCDCGNLSEMKIVCRGTYFLEDENEDYVVQEHYKILRCPSCHGVTVLRYMTGYTLIDLERQEPGPVYHKYQRQVLYTSASSTHPAIPRPIAEIVEQAQAICGVSPRAAIILCRTVLEEVCREKGIPDQHTNNTGKIIPDSLDNMLKTLFIQENMNIQLENIINGIRTVGNKGTHSPHVVFSENFSSDDSEILLDLLKYVLARIYVDRALAEEASENLEHLLDKIKNSVNSGAPSKATPHPA